MDIRMSTHDSDARFVVGKLTTLITHPLNMWVIEKHERTSIFNCNKKQCVYCCSSELCVHSSDLGSLCSFFRLGFSVFVLQTWVPCVRSSGIGTMRSFLRFGFSVFVLQNWILCVHPSDLGTMH